MGACPATSRILYKHAIQHRVREKYTQRFRWSQSTNSLTYRPSSNVVIRKIEIESEAPMSANKALNKVTTCFPKTETSNIKSRSCEGLLRIYSISTMSEDGVGRFTIHPRPKTYAPCLCLPSMSTNPYVQATSPVKTKH